MTETNVAYRTTFEYLALTFDNYLTLIPLTFLLGFYIGEIVKRWWSQFFEFIVWPDDLVGESVEWIVDITVLLQLSHVCVVFSGNDVYSRRCRHAIARYVNLSSVLCWRDVSPKIRTRFPTIKSLVSAGLMTQAEHALYGKIQVGCGRVNIRSRRSRRVGGSCRCNGHNG
jgi:hypothetical protein